MIRFKHKFGFHNRGVQWDTRCRLGREKEGLDTALGTKTTPQGRCDDEPPEEDEAAVGEEAAAANKAGAVLG